MVRRSVADFVEKYVYPNARKIDGGWYPREIITEMGKLGLLAPMGPVEYGGPGLDLRSQVIVIEELAKASPALATIAEVQGSMIMHALARFGSTELKERYLRRVITGELIVSFALSEPCCGSDAAAIETRAERVRDGWVINGTKLWITSGLYADAYLVFARTGPAEARHRTITAFLVERNSCVDVSPVQVMGIRGSGTAEVRFRDCEVSDDQVVGELNGGFSVAMSGINNGRLNVGAIGLGIGEASFNEALDYSRRRKAFGKSISEFQAIQHYLADLYADIESVRLLVYHTAYLGDNGDPRYPMHAQIAKLMGSRLAVKATRVAMQILGGYGYSTDSHVEMLYRDAKVTEIYEGTNEIILNTIFKFLSNK